MKTECAGSDGAQSPHTAPMQKLRPSWAAKLGTQVKECKNPVQSWGLGNEHPAARRKPPETAAKRQPGTHGFRARLLRREVRRWHASWSAVPLFAPSTVLAAVGGLRKRARGRRLCFHGGKCRRCGVAAGPASELVGLPAADACCAGDAGSAGGGSSEAIPPPRCDEVCCAEH